MKHAKCYKKGYPRPQFVREDYILLNGEWEFCFDEDNIGEQDKWFISHEFDLKITVPYPYQAKASGINNQKNCQVVWYKQKVAINTTKRAILNFEGSDYYTKVWVNGSLVGVNEGGYNRFSYDITNYIVGGVAEIVVRVEDIFDATQPRGKQRWQQASYACWYTEISGIWKTVWLEFVNSESIARVEYVTEQDNYFLTCNYYLNADTLADGDITLRTIIEYDSFVIVDSSQKVNGKTFSAKYDLRSGSIPFKVQNWTSWTPNIYDISFELSKGGKVIDAVGSYFGFAHYTTVNNYITSNSNTIYLKMILDQGYFENGILTASEEELLRDVQLVKEVGFNGIRKHQKIENEIFYYYCDILGVYCWLEMPSTFDYNNQAVERLVTQWTKIVRDYSNHPSIMAYVPFNESWGIPHVLNNKAQQDFTQGMYNITKALSGNKLVISNDGWEHTSSDILTLHNYGANGESLKKAFENMTDIINNKVVTAFPSKLSYALGHKYEGQPFMVSEFGGIAFAKDKKGDNWGYGAMEQDEESFLLRLDSLITYIQSLSNCSGYCLTQITDVMQEVNGLWTISRECKVDKQKLANIIKK